ncbi:MAG: hypothetical protein CMP24_03975 [Rickettsiales bacterium]|nr:hypothetical protein [Rickettsiales bacterium]MBJ57383.1 hypothetical protein [Rickettsiales bacterium]|tara:strand:- start:221 stop:1021 length:801 start_codon:yes stop_codon:yes gene_type:complete
MLNKSLKINKAKEEHIWVYGRHSVLSTIDNPKRRVLEILYSKRVDYFMTKIKSKIEKSKKNIITREVNISVIEKILDKKIKHQGIIAKCKKLDFDNFKKALKLYESKDSAIGLILNGVTDVNNVGAIYRSSLAFNVNFIITETRNTPAENSALINSSCGSFDKICTYKTHNINNTIKRFKEGDWWIVGLDQNGSLELSNFVLNHLPRKKLLFILGSEGKGISRLVKRNCDYLVKININEKSFSINVSNAAAILLYSLSKKNEMTKK